MIKISVKAFLTLMQWNTTTCGRAFRKRLSRPNKIINLRVSHTKPNRGVAKPMSLLLLPYLQRSLIFGLSKKKADKENVKITLHAVLRIDVMSRLPVGWPETVLRPAGQWFTYVGVVLFLLFQSMTGFKFLVEAQTVLILVTKSRVHYHKSHVLYTIFLAYD